MAACDDLDDLRDDDFLAETAPLDDDDDDDWGADDEPLTAEEAAEQEMIAQQIRDRSVWFPIEVMLEPDDEDGWIPVQIADVSSLEEAVDWIRVGWAVQPHAVRLPEAPRPRGRPGKVEAA